ncbi:hypothetical protein RSOLAG1IB_12482 [Rhizoctonia solani AG-1 IB]|uniref:Uncharacterized protein n=1 Tax=Thanatephorus cucumeris (strain AG1-IB / isolate 7/3/14) TaxID=1108050 RepID=A0A0B7FZC3_THACB|nr:hypothetical protein RSOLAG1IB_12482 [Rhizoctonia solani AG-1 IB]
MNQALLLKDLSGSHGQAKYTSTQQRLLVSLQSQQVHTFVPGRDYGWAAKDDLMVGKRVMENKVSNFLNRRTTSDGSHTQNMHENDEDPEELEENQNADNEDPPNPVMLPPIIVDGQLVTGYEAEDPTPKQAYEQIRFEFGSD